MFELSTSKDEFISAYKLQLDAGSTADVDRNGLKLGRWSGRLLGCHNDCIPNGFMSFICPGISVAQITARLGLIRYKLVLQIYAALWQGTLEHINREHAPFVLGQQWKDTCVSKKRKLESVCKCIVSSSIHRFHQHYISLVPWYVQTSCRNNIHKNGEKLSQGVLKRSYKAELKKVKYPYFHRKVSLTTHCSMYEQTVLPIMLAIHSRLYLPLCYQYEIFHLALTSLYTCYF
ncbi:unnamed protein product [Peronospora belbahrii]|uniref:Uncharacterized protein n=1 Tax=Peronospora belbahrii TaxID=622444 RepID=A0ABN8D4K2_9STRA|nr:unnamed protein product [Peronospora belbahrii]